MRRSCFSVSRATTLNAQRLRREATPFEKLLWTKLQRGQLAGFKFRRQHPVGPYILDFYCAELKVCVELDGDTHGDEAAVRDAARTAYLSEHGITVRRFWNDDVRRNCEGVAEAILAECAALDAIKADRR